MSDMENEMSNKRVCYASMAGKWNTAPHAEKIKTQQEKNANKERIKMLVHSEKYI